MTTNKSNSTETHSRLPVSLTVEDNRILLELCHVLETKLGHRLSYADVIRTCIRTQAKAEGIECK